MRLNLYTAPAAEPISIADIEAHCQLTSGSISTRGQTGAANMFIKAVRQKCDAVTRRQLISATWELILDGFPYDRSPIEIPLPPLKSIVSIKYYDPNNVLQTMDASLYRVLGAFGAGTATPKCQPGLVLPVQNEVWPSTLDDLEVVTIQFNAGYGTSGSNIPDGILNWMMINAANLWENRETEVMASGRLSQIDFSTLADGLIEDYRIYGW